MAIPVGSTTAQTLNIVRRVNGEIMIEQDVPCAFVPLVHAK